MKHRPYFVIFGAMRTGSNLLEKTLEGLGDTLCYGEPFNPSFIGGPRVHCLFGINTADRDEDPEGFLTMLRGEAGGLIPGFRLFDGHAPRLVPKLMRDPACRRIVLKRDPLVSYLSLLAARETGQWMLRNAHRRKEVLVEFDAVEFELYREQLAVHYAWLDAEMKQAGTDALRLDYEHLQDPATMARAAAHIGSSGKVPTEQPLLRQNPGRLPDRVSNYDEMCAWLGLNPEPRTQPVPPMGEDVLFCREAPLALAYLDGPGGDAALSLLYRVQARSYDGARVSQGQLADKQGRQAVFMDGLSGDVLKAELDRRFLMAMVCHPATRMHQLFLSELFGRHWHVSAVRRFLVRRYGGIPSPKELAEGSAALACDRHHEIFLGFLDLAASSREGAGPVPARRAWYSQADLLDRYTQLGRIDAVATLETLPAFAHRLTRRLDCDALPDHHITGAVEAGLRDDLPLSDVATDLVQARLRAHWGADFARFGYGGWPVSMQGGAQTAGHREAVTLLAAGFGSP